MSLNVRKLDKVKVFEGHQHVNIKYTTQSSCVGYTLTATTLNRCIQTQKTRTEDQEVRSQTKPYEKITLWPVLTLQVVNTNAGKKCLSFEKYISGDVHNGCKQFPQTCLSPLCLSGKFSSVSLSFNEKMFYWRGFGSHP